MVNIVSAKDTNKIVTGLFLGVGLTAGWLLTNWIAGQAGALASRGFRARSFDGRNIIADPYRSFRSGEMRFAGQ